MNLIFPPEFYFIVSLYCLAIGNHLQMRLLEGRIEELEDEGESDD